MKPTVVPGVSDLVAHESDESSTKIPISRQVRNRITAAWTNDLQDYQRSL
jgi:hypothetical protein